VRPVGIVLIEGADAAGKTSLAKRLVERFDARYLHSVVRGDVWRWHVGALRWAAHESQHRLIVMDRFFLSELVYATVFRGKPAYDVGARVLDRVLRRFAALTVLCVPTDLQEQEARWARGRADGKKEHFSSVREVIAAYADLRHGNVGCPDPSYFGQLVRFGDYTERDDVLVYDIDEVPWGRLNRFVDVVVERLAQLRRKSPAKSLDYAYSNLSGRGKTVFVGEAPGGRGSVNLPAWPWCGNEKNLDAASWFNRAVQLAGLDESRCCYMNVRLVSGEPDTSLQDTLWEIEPKRVVALGKVAARRLTELNVGHVTLPHPAWHRRFRYAEGPEIYAEKVTWAVR
jgi:thymidylate kinase